MAKTGPYGGVLIEVPGKPLYINAISKMDHWGVSKETKSWRIEFAKAAKVYRIQPIDYEVFVYVHHLCSKRLPDCGAIYWATKGGIDGLVDAGVLKDDSPRYVDGTMFLAPVKAAYDCVALELVMA